MMRGDPRAAMHHLELSRDLLSTRADGWALGAAHQRAAQLAELLGDIGGAYDHLVESTRHFEAAHVDYGVAVVSGDAGMMAMRLERYDEALVYTTRAREAAGALRMRGMECLFVTHLASMATRAGDLDLSDRLSTEAISIAQRNGVSIMEAHGQAARAVARFLDHRFDEAADAAHLAIDGFSAAGWGRSRTQPYAILGAVAVERGDLAAARRFYAAAYGSAQRVRHRRSIALVVEGLAGIAVSEGDAERGAMLLGFAESIRAGRGGGRPSLASPGPVARAAALVVLGNDAFEAAATRGRAVDTAHVDHVIRAEIGEVDAAAGEDVPHQIVGRELPEVLAPED